MNRRLLALALLAPLAALASGLTGNETISTIAGSGVLSSSGNGGPASAATLNVYHLQSGRAGNLYFADPLGAMVRRIDSAGNISAFAGTGTPGYSGDGGPATQAQLYQPLGVAIDGDGNVYIADSESSAVRKVAAGTGIITTIAGGNGLGVSGDGGLARQAKLNRPYGMAVGPDGSIYIADSMNRRIRKVDQAGTITTAYGNGLAGATGGDGDGGPAAQASFSQPVDVAFDAAGNLFILDGGWKRVRRVDTAGNIRSHAGGGTLSAEGTPGAQFQFLSPGAGFAVDTFGNVYVHDARFVRKIDAAPPHTVTNIAGTGVSGFFGDGGPARLAQIQGGNGLEFDALGNLYVGDFGRIRKISIPQPADLAVAKSCQPNPVNVNQDFTCTITVTNRGPGGAGAVQVVDTLSPAAGVTLVSATVANGTCPTAAPNLVICNLAALPPGGSASVTLVLRTSQPGTYTDTATVTATQTDPDLGNNTAVFTTTVTAPDAPADLAVTKRAAAAAVTLGQEAQFSIRVTNNGPNPATGVRITDIPALPPVRVLAPPPWTCTPAGMVPMACSLPLLAAGQNSPMIEVTLLPTAPGQYCNTVTVQADQSDPVAANNLPPQVCVTVVPPYALNEFVAFGNELLLLDRRSNVRSGAVGANTRSFGNTPEVFIRGPLQRHPAFFAIGDTVLLDAAQIPQVRSSDPVQLANGATAGTQLPAGFPLLALPALQPANPATQASADILVAANQTRTLEPGRYRSVTVNEGGTLFLRGYRRLNAPPTTPRGYDFLEIELKNGAKLLFSEPAGILNPAFYPLGVQVRVQRRVRAVYAAVIGPAAAQGALRASHIVFHVGGSDAGTTLQNIVVAVNIGPKSTLRANIYAPNGSVLLNRDTRATGAFIGKIFTGDAVDLTLESAF